MHMSDLTTIAGQFCSVESIGNITPLGNGLINDTFLVTTTAQPWVLQRINTTVFQQPLLIMQNLQCLTQHVLSKTAGQVQLKLPALLPTTQNASCWVTPMGDYWRALAFIPDSYSKESLSSVADAEQVGWALAHFHQLCSDLDTTAMHDTLPGFHITPQYLAQYQQTLTSAVCQADDERLAFCHEFVQEHLDFAQVLESAKQTGELKLRVTHGDPKVNNFLFDQSGEHIISLIDLDTVKPGLIHYDLGDCLRSCCHDPQHNEFDVGMCAVILRSYLHEAREFMSAADYTYLYSAIRLIPFELGLRFFTDYLQGNRYFKVSEPQENLERTVAQFQLCASIERQQQTIQDLIADLR